MGQKYRIRKWTANTRVKTHSTPDFDNDELAISHFQEVSARSEHKNYGMDLYRLETIDGKEAAVFLLRKDIPSDDSL